MQPADLKFPGDSNGTVRREVANAISNVENAVARGAEADPTFAAFLLDAAQKTPGYAATPLPDTQAIVTDGSEVTFGGITYTFTVEEGVITGIATA